MSRRYSDRPFTDDTELTADLLNQLVVSFDRAIDQLERFSPEWQQQIDAFNTNALKRVNDAVAPLMERIRTAIQGGFLVAQTQDVYALEQDAEIIFKIPEDSRVAFRPTPFLAVMAPDQIDDWALAQTLHYNEVTGDLTVKILFVHGSGAARAGWTVSAASGVVEAVHTWMLDVSEKHDEISETLDELRQLKDDIQLAALLIQGGPVSSVNTRTGAITLSKADVGLGNVDNTSDAEKPISTATATALAAKADAAATTAALATATELHKDFVASGAIAAGQYVVLRSDGKVEAVSGTETLASAGADNTSLTATTDFRLYGYDYNETSGKIVLIYTDWISATNHPIYGVVGTVVGNTITWGTPVTLDSGTAWPSSAVAGKVVFNAAGSTVVFLWGSAATATSLTWRVGSISGTTITLGTAVTTTDVVSGIADNILMVHDNTHGSRAVAYVNDSAGGSGRKIWAVTYSGTTLTVGTPVSLNMQSTFANGPVSMVMDGANARVIMLANSGTTLYISAVALSGTTVTPGTQVSRTSTYHHAAVLEASSGKIVVVFTAANTSTPAIPQALVLTFSGTTVTINTPVTLTSGLLARMTVPSFGAKIAAAMNTTSGKLVVAYHAQVDTNAIDYGHLVVQLGTISGTTITFTDPVAPPYVTVGYGGVILFSRASTGEVAIVVSAPNDYSRRHVLTGIISSGVFTFQDDTLIRSTMPTSGALTSTAASVMLDYTLVDLGNWSAATATAMTAFAVTLPTETTNADNWIGVAKATVADGESVTVALRGGLDKSRSGLTAKTRYFLKGDGTLITNDNGRPAGLALSATELLMEAL